jgi:hypothetical protein
MLCVCCLAKPRERAAAVGGRKDWGNRPMVELFIPLTRHVTHAVDALNLLGREPPSTQLCRGRVGGRAGRWRTRGC